MNIPKHLKKGSKVAAMTLSWGGPGTFSYRYNIGKKQCEDSFDIKIIETKHTLTDAQTLYIHPEYRAEDLMSAFLDDSIDAIFSTIGGEDSIRILPYIDFSVIIKNPKIFMGYSDSTITHFICYKAGVRSYYGPSIMAGFGENGGIFSYTSQSVQKTLFDKNLIGTISPNQEGWTNELLDWSNPENQKIKRNLKQAKGWKWLQGTGVHQGKLLGGCIDTFPFMIGTAIWPSLEDWENVILFIETSEEKMTKIHFERILRNLGSQGILQVLKGIIMGRVQFDYTKNTQINYDDSLIKIIKGELGLDSLPIITNMDFGHTDPMFVLPYGAQATINCESKKFSIDESGCL